MNLFFRLILPGILVCMGTGCGVKNPPPVSVDSRAGTFFFHTPSRRLGPFTPVANRLPVLRDAFEFQNADSLVCINSRGGDLQDRSHRPSGLTGDGY